MPTASAAGNVKNTHDTPNTYRVRLIIQRYTPDMMSYLSPIYGAWSSTTNQILPGQVSAVVTAPPVVFDLLGGYYARALVQVSAINPPNDLAGLTAWQPEPPFMQPAAVISANIGPGMMWWSGLPSWIDYSPQSVPYGTMVYTAPTWINQSTVPIVGTVVLTTTRPSGSIFTSGAILNQSKSANPGSGWAVQFTLMPMTEYGVYTIVADLYVEGIKVATTTYTLSMLQVVPVYTISMTPYMKDSALNTYIAPDASGKYSLVAGREYFTWASIVVTKTLGGVVQNNIDLAVVNSHAITGTPQGQPGAGTYKNPALGYPVNAMPSGATVQPTMTITIAAGTAGATGVITYDVQTMDGVARKVLTLPVVVV